MSNNLQHQLFGQQSTTRHPASSTTNSRSTIDFIDYFNLVEQYMRSEQIHSLNDDKEEEEEDIEINTDEQLEDEEEEEDDDDEERATTQFLQQRLSMFINSIKHRLQKKNENLSFLFHDDVFGQLKAISFVSRQFHFSSIENLVGQCHQLILEKYCYCVVAENDDNDNCDTITPEQVLMQYKNQNELVHGQLLELDTACAYSFEYIRFKCCRDLLLALTQPALKKVMIRIRLERERIEQNLKMCTIHPSQERELFGSSTINMTNERYKWYSTLLKDVDNYLMMASDLSLSLQFSKQMP
jgi:hypothetical protein